MAEDVMVHLYFSRDFALGRVAGTDSAGEALRPFRQPGTLDAVDYGGYASVEVNWDTLPADCCDFFTLSGVTLPSRPGKHDVPVRIWEKRLGKSESVLTFNVT